MRYKIFLSDFDGTLVREDGTVSVGNRRAIETYRAAGGVFAVVTGRMFTSIRPRLLELGLGDGLAVAYQGSMIVSLRSGEILRCGGFSEGHALTVIRFLEKTGYHVHVYTPWEFYSDREDEFLASYERICGVKGRIEPNLSDMVAEKHLNVIKVLAMVQPAEREPLRLWLTEALGEEFYVTSSAGTLVEVMPKGEDKGSAVGFLSEYYGVPLQEIAAIGDRLNDLPMLERAGGRFAVANAEAALKERAVVVPSCEEDGVAEAIMKYALGEEG